MTMDRAIYRYDGGFAAMKKYDGQAMTILRPTRVPEESDAEVGPMFLVRFDDGVEHCVFADEIEKGA